jgi:hypothetical protein
MPRKVLRYLDEKICFFIPRIMKNPMKANRSKDKKRGTFIGSYEKNGVTRNVVVLAPQRTIRPSTLFDSIFQGYRTPWVKSLKAAPPFKERPPLGSIDEFLLLL